MIKYRVVRDCRIMESDATEILTVWEGKSLQAAKDEVKRKGGTIECFDGFRWYAIPSQ